MTTTQERIDTLKLELSKLEEQLKAEAASKLTPRTITEWLDYSGANCKSFWIRRGLDNYAILKIVDGSIFQRRDDKDAECTCSVILCKHDLLSTDWNIVPESELKLIC